ncbi:MAG: hypothetical protein PUG55_05695 [Bacillales bacterium]|nr:hypothetical protein [Bacillales bacterium]
MKKLKNEVKKLESLEDEFFEINHETKENTVKLRFHNPEEIFDLNAITKTPILSDEFFEWIASSMEYTPKKYKINIIIYFDDMGDYNEQQLLEIYEKNIALDIKKTLRKAKSKKMLAYSLFGIGILLLTIKFLISGLWDSPGLIGEIINEVIEICDWVVVWEAFAILLLERKERLAQAKEIARKFNRIEFKKIEK